MIVDLTVILCGGVGAMVLVAVGAAVGFSWGHHLGTLDSLRPKA